MIWRRLAPTILCVTLASCGACDRAPSGTEGASAGAPAASAATGAEGAAASGGADASADAGAADADPSADAGAADADASADADAADADASADAGAAGAPAACRLVYGPAEQPFRGPAALAVSRSELRLVVNEGGIPRVHAVPIRPPPPRGRAPVVPPKPTQFRGVRWPPCALAGRYAYCEAAGGAITRTSLDAGGQTKKIASGRGGTRIAAAPLGSDHSIVGFLDLRHTTEGPRLQAFVALDERPPVRLSDDGAGATALRFLPVGDGALAVYLDARTSMVPVHARPVRVRGAELALGDDAVVFVGGPPERGIDLAVAAAGAARFAFIPMPRDAAGFGMAAIAIADPPKVDVPAVWSPYPNGLDPAALGASRAREGEGAWVARVRPRAAAPDAPHVVELGKVDALGSFTSLGEIADGTKITDVEVIEDEHGGVWILYGGATATWLERRICD